MKQIELVIQNPTGLHARPAKVLVNLVKQFKSEIRLLYGEKKANAKSMVSVLTLGVHCGGAITVQANGDDEDVALAEVESAIRSGLGDTLTHPTPVSASEPVLQAPTAQPVSAPATGEGVMQGIGAAPGIAIGPVFHFEHENLEVASGIAKISLSEALTLAKAQLAGLHQQMVEKKLGADAAIFEAHAELLEDPELVEAVQMQMDTGQNPLVAWNTAINERAEALAALKDPILSARAADVQDVGRRVLRLLLGLGEKSVTLPEHPVIVLSRELSPSDTASFDPARVLGFAIVEGGPTSHIAILARALGLPALVGVDEAMLALPGQTPVILNGNDGTLSTNPAPAVLDRARQEQTRWLEYRRLALEQALLPAVTADGHHLDISANAGSVADAVQALKMSADGIGLLRTEFLFLERNTAPSEEEQFNVYRAIAEAMHNRPVIIRTLDIGGDKPLPYIQLKPELNPFLGERGIRLCMNRLDLFREQLRAILRASQYGNLRIMFPMVSDVGEVRQARALMDQICQELGLPAIPFGIMVEVPSAALLAEKLAPEIDFFSIGTNDLTQYTLAIDRGNPTLANRHDGLHPAVLRLISHTINGAHKYGKRADLCGELGSDPAAVPILIGLGMDELSVSIPSVPTVKAQVRGLNFAQLQPLAQQALECATAHEVRELVKKYFA